MSDENEGKPKERPARGPGWEPDPDRPLSVVEEKFVNSYMETGSLAEAGRRTFGDAPSSANSYPSKIMARPHVAAEIGRRREEIQIVSNVRAAEVLRHLAMIAFYDPADVFDFTGESVVFRKASDIPEEARKAIASIKTRKIVEGKGKERQLVEVLEVKFHSRLDALSQLMRHLGLYKDTITLEAILGLFPEHIAERLRGLLAQRLGP